MCRLVAGLLLEAPRASAEHLPSSPGPPREAIGALRPGGSDSSVVWVWPGLLGSAGHQVEGGVEVAGVWDPLGWRT